MLKRILIFIFILTEFSFAIYSQRLDSTEIRINELLSKMTLKEKIGQMNQLTGFGLAEKMKADK